MRNVHHSSLIAAACLLALTSGCSSATRSPGLPPTAPQLPAPTQNVTFSIKIPGGIQAAARVPKYVSASTQSAKIVVTPAAGGALPAVTIGCNAGACTGSVAAPVGNDGFAVSLYDAPSGTGNILSSGATTQSIVSGQPNSVNLTFNPVLSTVGLVLQNASLSAGTAADDHLTVSAKDPDGNTIVGPGIFIDTSGNPTPITLATSDNTNHGALAGSTVLSVSSVTSPGTTVTVSYNGKPIAGTTVSATAGALTIPSAQISYTPGVVATFTASRRLNVRDAVADAAGTMWLSEEAIDANDRIAKITSAGVYSEIPVDTNIRPGGITIGADSNIWFAESNNFSVGKVTPAGVFTEVPAPGGSPTDSVAAGSDGTLWFTFTQNPNALGSLPTSGTGGSTFAPFPGAKDFANGIATGPDGNLWICDTTANAIVKVNPANPNAGTAYTIPTPAASARRIASGPDGNLWFTETNANKVGKITPGGTFTEYVIPSTNSMPDGIRAGADGNVWFNERNAYVIGRITPQGTITEFPMNITGSGPIGATNDGYLYNSYVETIQKIAI